MQRRSLADWLRWQETLHPRPVDLGLERVARVWARLALQPPAGRVFTVAGTNGKGSTVAALDALLRATGSRPGTYTSPHLLRYNERVSLDGVAITDEALVSAFERVEEARGGERLTYFEFGTLAACVAFAARHCDSWILEVGLGGRLDAVNVVDPDFALITTIGLDHQEWLGSTIEEIAAEKAGILRPGRPAFYGDEPLPRAISSRVAELRAPLATSGRDFGTRHDGAHWSWWRGDREIEGLCAPPTWTAAQFRNAGLAMAALDAGAGLPAGGPAALSSIFAQLRVPGRFQRILREREWILDVAHNPQAAAVLHAQLATLSPAPTTIVASLLADKAAVPFINALAGAASCWITCPVDDPRSSTAAQLAAAVTAAGVGAVEQAASAADAMARATAITPAGGRIVVCGSFRMVAPAMQWLGLY
jgi:dihydrofolate synthase/folylpolyglutamate synthase